MKSTEAESGYSVFCLLNVFSNPLLLIRDLTQNT